MEDVGVAAVAVVPLSLSYLNPTLTDVQRLGFYVIGAHFKKRLGDDARTPFRFGSAKQRPTDALAPRLGQDGDREHLGYLGGFTGQEVRLNGRALPNPGFGAVQGEVFGD